MLLKFLYSYSLYCPIPSFKGTIYLINEVPEQEKCSEAEPPSLMDIYGHKFEQYMTGGMFSIVAQTDELLGI